ncbi:MAG: response regulator [Cyanobacteria bacterium P01_H01_bin.150]
MAKKILVIEHISETCNKFLEFLKAQYFDTVSSENAFIGIHRALQESPDLIICNMMMPRLDGYQILTTLRQNSVTATIPVILIGVRATPTPTEYRKAMEFGADYFLSEPFTLDELLRAITICLEKRATLKHYYAGM